MVARVTRQAVEILAEGTGNTRVTRLATEVLADGTGNARVTRFAIEVLAASPIVGGSLTSIMGNNAAIHGIGFTLGLGAAGSSSNILSATSSISFAQTASVEKIKPVTATSAISFTQTNARAGSFSQTATSALSLSQTNIVSGPKPVTAASSISFSHAGASSILSRSASSYLSLSQSAYESGVIELTGSSSLSLSQSSSSGLISRSAYSFLDLDQIGAGGFVSINAVPLTASSSLTLTDVGSRALALASGTALTGSNSLTLTQRAIVPIEVTADNTIAFTQTSTGNAGKTGTTTIAFSQTVVANHWRSLTASNAVSFSHGFSAVQFRDGLPIQGNNSCDATKTYSPYSGGDNAIIRPVAPALTRKTDVEFFYPTGAVCSATTSIVLRTPNFGDRDRNQYNRINRESRGGSLQIFRDPDWPSIRTLVMDFSGIKDSEVDGIIDFLESTLGLEISFRDWNSRVWNGLIINPDSAITRTGTNRNDIALEMEVTDTGLEVNACSELVLAQGANRGNSILSSGPTPP